MSEVPPPGEGVRRFAGLIVIVFGVFFLAFGGLCGSLYLLAFFVDGSWIDLRHGLMVTVPAALVGWLMISHGRKLQAKR